MHAERMTKTTVVIGAGFAGLAAASHLARAGRRVVLLEKCAEVGGRARRLVADGFTFDRGPSWYWMPDVFEGHFAHFGRKPSDYYRLQRLDPSYSVYFGAGDRMDLPASMDGLRALFERHETGAAKALDRFLDEARRKYTIAMRGAVHKPSLSPLEYAEPRLLRDLLRMPVLGSLSRDIRRRFKDPRLVSVLEFPALFLGSTPRDTPALFTLLNHADMALGTWYPMGGMAVVVDGMAQLAQELGVEIRTGEAVRHIAVEGSRATQVTTDKGAYSCDQVVAAADYHHVEQHLLDAPHRVHDARYWEGRTMAPSVLMFYIGLDRRLKDVPHHMLFFDEPLDPHAHTIYRDPQWPERPLFYVSCTSVTDPSVAPPGMENMVVLIPIAPGLSGGEAVREHYFRLVMDRMERLLGQPLREHVVHRSSCSVSDLEADMNAYKGNAYGLAMTLRQTAFMRPAIRNRKVPNLYYAGQLTVPGPGVPPAIISGELVARRMLQDLPA